MQNLVAIVVVSVILLTAPKLTLAWDNGLARTPPMGWMSWQRYACQVDCIEYPDSCINENLYRDMIDHIVDDGYLKVGYNFVNIDDCWMVKDARDPHTRRLLADQSRFPSTIEKLVEYAHSKNVLLGIYEDIGTMTCGGYPGTFFKNVDHTEIDTETFSDWKIDSVKVDGCYAPIEDMEQRYINYRKALSKVEHKIMYACSWPAYLDEVNQTDKVYASLKENCNYWRNYDDIYDSWQSVSEIINYYGKHNEQYIKFHGPGGWFDPDMLIIGNNGLSYEQSKTQMAFWCMWSAPLLMSNDLRKIKPEFKEILLNKELIALDQDPLGIMASRVYATQRLDRQVWVKKLFPDQSGSPNPYAVLYFNNQTLGPDTFMSFKLSTIISQLNQTLSYDVYDLFQNTTLIETLKPEQELKLLVPTSGSVRVVKLVPKF